MAKTEKTVLETMKELFAGPEANFMEYHRPKHTAAEALHTLIAGTKTDPAKALKDYAGQFAGTADTTQKRPQNLFDLYEVDPRLLFVDLENRKDHYDERQQEIIGHLLHQTKPSTPITDEEKTRLVVTYMQQAAPKKQAPPKPKKDEDDEIVLEDGRTLEEAVAAEKAEPSFEKQDFGDKIIV